MKVLNFQEIEGERYAFFLSLILDSSMVEHSAVNRVVVGSSPTRGVCNRSTGVVPVDFLCKKALDFKVRI